ncbi:hypothetical protein DMENIID0001_152810 [Sergentomyia squamirostris]
MDQREELVENYKKLQSFFEKSLTFFNLDFFNKPRNFRIYNLFFVFTLFISHALNIRNVLITKDQVIPLVYFYNFAWFIVHFAAITRFFTFIFNKKEFLELLEDFEELHVKQYSHLIAQIQLKNYGEIYKMTVALMMGFAIGFWITEFLALAYLFTLPGIDFPMIYNIPIMFDMPRVYYISNMIIHFYFYFLLLTIVTLGDLFVIFFGLYFRCELKTLAEIIEFYLDNSEIVNRKKNLLKEIFEKHLQILNMLKILENVYRQLSFYQFLSSFFCCFCCFYGTLVQDKIEGTIYMMVCIAVAELFALCLFGETLVAHTEQLGVSIYLTKWYEMSLSEQKNLLYIMRIAQKPIGIKAAGLIDVNFFTFVEAMKGAVSYCAILYALTK